MMLNNDTTRRIHPIESSLEQNIEKWYRALVCTISKQEDSRPHVNFAVCSPSSSSATKYSRVMLYTSRGQKQPKKRAQPSVHTALCVHPPPSLRFETRRTTRSDEENTFTSSRSLNQLPERKVIPGTDRNVDRKRRVYKRYTSVEILRVNERHITREPKRTFFFLIP